MKIYLILLFLSAVLISCASTQETPSNPRVPAQSDEASGVAKKLASQIKTLLETGKTLTGVSSEGKCFVNASHDQVSASTEKFVNSPDYHQFPEVSLKLPWDIQDVKEHSYVENQSFYLSSFNDPGVSGLAKFNESLSIKKTDDGVEVTITRAGSKLYRTLYHKKSVTCFLK